MSKMIITSLELVNYTRMSLAGINRFVFMPDDAYALQTILGTNGSGKSSLMWELWPLPGNVDDFGTNGKKDLKITYKGKYYELISTFEGSKPKHEFIIDGVEQNDGYKIEMFRNLCEEHFQVTGEIRALALEADPLSAMTPARRRYWMVKLADSDFTYAMNAYKKLTTQHRDAQGAINRLQKRIVDETNKLVAKEVVDGMVTETNEIKALIQEIYGLRNNASRKIEDVFADMTSIENALNMNCADIDRLNLSLLETSGYTTREQMLETRESIKLQVHAAQQLNQHLFTDHQRIKKKYDMLIKAGTESIGELEKKKKDAQDEIAFKETFIAMRTVAFKSDPHQMKDALQEMYNDLSDKLAQLPANDGEFTPEKAQEAETKIRDLSGQITPMQARVARLVEDIEHRRTHVQQDSITCPHCNHNWTTKASEEDLKKADVVVAQMKERLEELEDYRKTTKKYLAECQEWAHNFRAIVTMMRSAPILSPYFNEISQNDRIRKFPGSVAMELYTVLSDLDHHIEIRKNYKIIEHASEQIELKKNLDADTLESIEKDLRHIEETMGVQTNKLQTFQTEANAIDSLIRQYDLVTKLNDQILNNHHMQQEYAKEWIYSRYQELLWHLIMSLQTQLARKEDALSAAVSQQAIVDEITRQLQEAQMNERIAKAAHVALSPTNGAIAEGLHRFINVYVMKMNKVINSVWSYPLEILPFHMEDGTVDMDYKFPFMKNKDGKRSKDVVEGSESMVDIFNFAFRMCALLQLGLGHLPLFLDEFESAFDDTHRERAIYFVKKLLDEQVYGQIFMVSHYESNHGALSSLAQTCVLSKDNLLLPTNVVFNQHVIIN